MSKSLDIPNAFMVKLTKESKVAKISESLHVSNKGDKSRYSCFLKNIAGRRLEFAILIVLVPLRFPECLIFGTDV